VYIVYCAASLSEYLRTKDLYRTRLYAEKEGYAEGITFSDLETAISVEDIGRLNCLFVIFPINQCYLRFPSFHTHLLIQSVQYTFVASIILS